MTASQAMSRRVRCLRPLERAGDVFDTLQSCEHDCFPVVDDEGGDILVGTILRSVVTFSRVSWVAAADEIVSSCSNCTNRPHPGGSNSRRRVLLVILSPALVCWLLHIERDLLKVSAHVARRAVARATFGALKRLHTLTLTVSRRTACIEGPANNTAGPRRAWGGPAFRLRVANCSPTIRLTCRCHALHPVAGAATASASWFSCTRRRLGTRARWV